MVETLSTELLTKEDLKLEVKVLKDKVLSSILHIDRLVKLTRGEKLKRVKEILSKILANKYRLEQSLLTLDKIHSIDSRNKLLVGYGRIYAFDTLVGIPNVTNSSRLPALLAEYLLIDNVIHKIQFGLYMMDCIELYLMSQVKGENKSSELLKSAKRERYKHLLSSEEYDNVFFIVEGSSDTDNVRKVSKTLFCLQTGGMIKSNALDSTISILLKAGKIGFILTDPDSAGKTIASFLKEKNPALIDLKIPLAIASRQVEGKIKAGVEYAENTILSEFIYESTKKYVFNKNVVECEKEMAVELVTENETSMSKRGLRIRETRISFKDKTDNDLEQGFNDVMVQIKILSKGLADKEYSDDLITPIAKIKRLTTKAIRYDNRQYDLTGEFLVEKEVVGFTRNAPRNKRNVKMLPSFYTTKLRNILKDIESSNCPYKIKHLSDKVKYNLTKLSDLETSDSVFDGNLSEDLVADM